MVKENLPDIVVEALKTNAGSATIVEVSRYIWNNYETELRKSGDLFYTWQYDARWAATQLRKSGIMKTKEISPRGVWELSKI
ncbi:hypothetical protein [Dehalobacterium formicoaceticum]|uniref:Restriction system protein Mrr-like N-terminal domain-containing protein n=1 Tax=Dehalobacterium formicoaceticum TaxID=51515 RepID=A0ABT1Y807_9FIRM|nr:hypothetical protein [Dehalobacterium formicoaceticum]MCR6547018.1 hypothetical protein [Dehalobacterium formicoaceticum]